MTNDNEKNPDQGQRKNKYTLDPEMEKKLAILEEKTNRFVMENEQEHKKNFGDPAKSSSEEKEGKRAASEFLGSVMGGTILGFGIDYFLDTAPWGFFIFILLGFVSGVMRANATINKNTDTATDKKND